MGLGEDATGEFSVVATADAIRAVADVVGLEHVALGSGFDAGRATPIPPDHLILLTQVRLFRVARGVCVWYGGGVGVCVAVR